MNGWNYVEGNPIVFTDPTGNVPRPPFGPEGAEYSCNCGWIDWSHANLGNAQNIIQRINSVQRKPGKDAGISRFATVSGINIHDPTGGVKGTIRVETTLGENSGAVYAVSLGVYMSIENAFERYQGGNPLGLASIPNAIWRSSFSEEDLMSDLIAFYIAAGLERREGSAQTLKDEIRRICGVVGLDDYWRGDFGTYNVKQAMIYYATEWEFGKVTSWFSPKLYSSSILASDPYCVDDCNNEPQKIPPKFLQISPESPNENSWYWESVYAFLFGDEILGGGRWYLNTEELNREKLDKPR
jgi:hypothetical protein